MLSSLIRSTASSYRVTALHHVLPQMAISLERCYSAAGRDDKGGKGWRQWMDDRLSVTDAIRQGADGRQMTFDEAAQEKRLPDSAELPIDVGQHHSSADPAYNEAATPSAAELEPELPGLPSRETTAGAAEPADSRRLRAGRAAAGPAQRASGAEGPSASAAGRLPAVGSTAGNQAQAQGGPASQAQLPLSAATEVAQQREADSPSEGPPEAATAAGDPEEPATDSDSQDLAEEDEVLLFTAWVRERLEQQAQEADAPSEGGGEGQATLAPSRRDEDGPHMISGYSELGAQEPSLLQQELGLDLGRQQLPGPRVNPTRDFQAGAIYRAEDLVQPQPSYKDRRIAQQQQRDQVVRLTNAEVRRQADFRNLRFLDQFVTRTGQLQPRRRTGLKQHVHRHLMRQIKTARQMALLPPLDRREEFRRPSDVLRLFGRKRSWENNDEDNDEASFYEKPRPRSTGYSPR